MAITAITPPVTNSSLHPIMKLGTRASATKGVTAWPIMPIRKVSIEILPLFLGGESSPMYVETRLRSAPTPIPVTNLQKERVIIPTAAASPKAPIAVSTIVRSIILNLPYLSESVPMMYEPNM